MTNLAFSSYVIGLAVSTLLWVLASVAHPIENRGYLTSQERLYEEFVELGPIFYVPRLMYCKGISGNPAPTVVAPRLR